MQPGQLHWLIFASLSMHSNTRVVKLLEALFAFHHVVFAFRQSTPTIQWNSNNSMNISSHATCLCPSLPSSILVH